MRPRPLSHIKRRVLEDAKFGVYTKITAAALGISRVRVCQIRKELGVRPIYAKRESSAAHKTLQIGIWISPEIDAKLRAQCKAITISRYIRNLIEADLAQAQLARPANASPPHVPLHRPDA